MTSPAIKIVGVELVDLPMVDGKGQHLANFTCEISGVVRIGGCSLLRFNGGQIRAFPPTIEKRHGGGGAVRILDNHVRDILTESAHRAYLAIGGSE